MPPKKRVQSSQTSTTKETCCVCCQSIVVEKDEALFCAGACQQWLHRYCASVSVKCYTDIKKSNSPFFCFCCSKDQDKREILRLKEHVEHLKRELAELKESLPMAQSGVRGSAEVNQVHHVQPSQAPVVRSGESDATNPNTLRATLSPSTSEAVVNKENYHHDRKFNVIVFGIDECSKGTSKHVRLESDLSSVVSVLSGLNSNIHSQSIKDIYRLGKFNRERKHPRPLLVKFIRAADVSSILSKRGSLHHPVFIKPDLTPEQRRRDSVLLNERWNLINSGIPRADIKIRDSRLFVQGKLYGYFSKSQFHHTKHDIHLSTITDAVSKVHAPIVSVNIDAMSSETSGASPTIPSTSFTPLCSMTNSSVQSTSPCDLPQSLSVGNDIISD